MGHYCLLVLGGGSIGCIPANTRPSARGAPTLGRCGANTRPSARGAPTLGRRPPPLYMYSVATQIRSIKAMQRPVAMLAKRIAAQPMRSQDLGNSPVILPVWPLRTMR